MRDRWVRGNQGFLPSGALFLFESQVAIARYSGWQIAYILWGKRHHGAHSVQRTPPGPLRSAGVGGQRVRRGGGGPSSCL